MDELRLLHELIQSVHKNDNAVTDFEQLLPAIQKHKLQPYFRKLIDKEIPQLENQIQSIIDYYNISIGFLEELQQYSKQPLIIIKGLANYHLTNGRILLRGTSDIDLVSSNPHALKEELLSQGFHETKAETGHELSELKKENILIDLHKFVPVVSYPTDINGISPDTIMTTTEGMSFSGEITYDDLVLNSIQLFKHVLIPNVNMSLIILCSSMFRDYITRVDVIPHFKLVDLVEVYLLLQEPTFHAETFLRLSSKFHASHAVEFVNTLLQKVYQIGIPDVNTTVKHFPQILFWNLHSWVIPNSMTSIIFDSKFESALINLGAQPLVLPNNRTLYLDLQKDIEPLTPVHFLSKNGNHIPSVHVSITWNDKMHIRAELRDVEQIHDKDIINFNFGTAKITVLGNIKNIEKFGGTSKQVNLNYHTTSRTLSTEFFLAPDELGHYLLEDSKLGLNLYIEKHEQGNEVNCIIPLIVMKKEVGF